VFEGFTKLYEFNIQVANKSVNYKYKFIT
jgi:hypothetical protein